jgi:hypothetical protein
VIIFDSEFYHNLCWLNDHETLLVQPGVEFMAAVKTIHLTNLPDELITVGTLFRLVQQNLHWALNSMAELAPLVINISFNSHHSSSSFSVKITNGDLWC